MPETESLDIRPSLDPKHCHSMPAISAWSDLQIGILSRWHQFETDVTYGGTSGEMVMFFCPILSFLGKKRKVRSRKQWVYESLAEVSNCWQTASVTPSTCSLRAVWYSIILINVPFIPQHRLMNQTPCGCVYAHFFSQSALWSWSISRLRERCDRLFQVLSMQWY